MMFYVLLVWTRFYTNIVVASDLIMINLRYCNEYIPRIMRMVHALLRSVVIWGPIQ